MAPEEEDFAALLAEFEGDAPKQGRGPSVGDMVKGTVISVGAEAVFVDLGAKAEGMLELDQVSDKDGNVTVQVGDTVEARVVDLGGKTGCILLRRVMAKGAEARSELVQSYEHRIPVEGLVTAVIKGGLEVQIAGVRAFCPASQIDKRYVEDLDGFVGQRFEFRITKIEPGRGDRVDLVVSRRAILEEEAEVQADELRGRLEVGAVLPGVVTTIKDYGAFVDLGGIEGMLHISELGFQRVGHPSEMLREGQRLEVQVKKIEQTGDAKRPEKISLSLKSLERDPWAEIADRFPQGSKVQGQVVRLQPFGAFVELAPGVEGLVHISQMASDKRIAHPREVVSQGQTVEVSILAVDPDKRRISLSMTAHADAAAAAETAADLAAHKASTQSKSLGTFADLLKDKFGK